jgi:hypothetical protein
VVPSAATSSVPTEPTMTEMGLKPVRAAHMSA